MSTILELTTQINEVGALIARYERALIDSPSRSVEASLRSLSKRLTRLQEDFATIAAGAGVDVCKYRFFSEYLKTKARPVGQAIVDFQAVFTQAYNAIQNGPRIIARITPDVEELTSFGFGYSYAGSLGIALTFTNDQLELFETTMDEAMGAVFELARAQTSADLAKQGKRLGPPAIKAVYKWASTHATYGLGADIAWVHGEQQKNRLVMESHAMAHLVGILQNTTHKEVEEIQVEGVFAGGEHAAKHTFHFIADSGEDYKGKYTDAISEDNPVLWPKRYRARLQKTTKVYYAADADDKPTYVLLSLEPLN